MDNIEAKKDSAPELGLAEGSADSLNVKLEWAGNGFLWVASSSDGKFVAQARSTVELVERCNKMRRAYAALQNKVDNPSCKPLE